MTRLVSTSAGPVEVLCIPGRRAPVVFLPGGHCSAACNCGWDLYTESGYGVIAFSRPGYGRTRVGMLTAQQFVPLVREVLQHLDVREVAAVVGVSFGGLQAACLAGPGGLDPRRLVLHSSAPARSAYPSSRVEALGGGILFSPALQGGVWAVVRRLIRKDRGLRLMMARLSYLPVAQWWDSMTSGDKDDARALFGAMRSDRGFVNDLRQGRREGASRRARTFSTVTCPTLITGSAHDRGVPFGYARELADLIPQALLMESDSPSHLFWIGRQRTQLAAAVAAFLGSDS